MNQKIPSGFNKVIEFAKAASDVCKERGKVYEFTCPHCGGKAHASKALCNGHLHASCEKCGFGVME